MSLGRAVFDGIVWPDKFNSCFHSSNHGLFPNLFGHPFLANDKPLHHDAVEVLAQRRLHTLQHRMQHTGLNKLARGLFNTFVAMQKHNLYKDIQGK